MLNSIYSIQTRKQGVVDISEDGNFKPIVPLIYKDIVFQKYGIVAYTFEGTCNSYLFDGTPIFSNAINPIFLADNLLLISSNAGQCYLINYEKNKPVFNKGFDAILFFIGSNPQAIPYTSKSNFSSYFKTIDYSTNGAHLEDLICAKIGNKWGVLNYKSGTIHANFIYNVMVQCTGLQIAAKDADGTVKQL